VVLDIGDDVGALIIITPAAMAGRKSTSARRVTPPG
jgi:hypothetical protein